MLAYLEYTVLSGKIEVKSSDMDLLSTQNSKLSSLVLWVWFLTLGYGICRSIFETAIYIDLVSVQILHLLVVKKQGMCYGPFCTQVMVGQDKKFQNIAQKLSSTVLLSDSCL